MNELHLYLYGEIGPQCDDYEGEVYDTKWLVSMLNSKLDADTIVVHLNTPGGDVSEGFAMHDILATSGKTIITIVEGRCASIGTVVALAGSVRKITRYSTELIHNPWQYSDAGDADYFRGIADGLTAVEMLVAQFYAEKTGQDINTLLQYMKEAKELTADMCKELGFATEIIETVKAKAYFNQSEIMSKPNLMDRLNAAMKALKGDGVKNADYATADGQTISINTTADTIAEGDTCTIAGVAPLDGDYKLTDGRTITVVSGKITAIKPAEAPAATPAPAATAPAAVSVEAINALSEVVTQMVAKVDEMQTQFASVNQNVNTIQASVADQGKVVEQITGAVELIGTSMSSAGFKKILNRSTLNEDGDKTKKSAETQKQNAIDSVRERRMGIKKPAEAGE